ncbi:unnamed protein product [Rhodiola kirilowii]
MRSSTRFKQLTDALSNGSAGLCVSGVQNGGVLSSQTPEEGESHRYFG